MGRLVEVTLCTPLTLAECDAFQAEARMRLTAARGPVVVFGDLASLDVMPGDIADRLLDLVRRDSPHVERGAYLMRKSTSSLPLQMARIFRDGKNKARRLVHDKEGVVQWLMPLLNAAEQARLTALLAAIAID